MLLLRTEVALGKSLTFAPLYQRGRAANLRAAHYGRHILGLVGWKYLKGLNLTPWARLNLSISTPCFMNTISLGAPLEGYPGNPAIIIGILHISVSPPI